jgi:hypothetical protein
MIKHRDQRTKRRREGSFCSEMPLQPELHALLALLNGETITTILLLPQD